MRESRSAGLVSLIFIIQPLPNGSLLIWDTFFSSFSSWYLKVKSPWAEEAFCQNEWVLIGLWKGGARTSLISITSPATGVYKSLTVFTDSTAPKTSWKERMRLMRKLVRREWQNFINFFGYIVLNSWFFEELRTMINRPTYSQILHLKWEHGTLAP